MRMFSCQMFHWGLTTQAQGKSALEVGNHEAANRSLSLCLALTVMQISHIELQDATGDKPGIVIVEVPAKPQWCEIRNTVFKWTPTRFPFHTSSAKKLSLNQTPVITVAGKAFFDVGHSLKDQEANRGKVRCTARLVRRPSRVREGHSESHPGLRQRAATRACAKALAKVTPCPRVTRN